jgi:hypothetical protein
LTEKLRLIGCKNKKQQGSKIDAVRTDTHEMGRKFLFSFKVNFLD